MSLARTINNALRAKELASKIKEECSDTPRAANKVRQAIALYRQAINILVSVQFTSAPYPASTSCPSCAYRPPVNLSILIVPSPLPISTNFPGHIHRCCPNCLAVPPEPSVLLGPTSAKKSSVSFMCLSFALFILLCSSCRAWMGPGLGSSGLSNHLA